MDVEHPKAKDEKEYLEKCPPGRGRPPLNRERCRSKEKEKGPAGDGERGPILITDRKSLLAAASY